MRAPRDGIRMKDKEIQINCVVTWWVNVGSQVIML